MPNPHALFKHQARSHSVTNIEQRTEKFLNGSFLTVISPSKRIQLPADKGYSSGCAGLVMKIEAIPEFVKAIFAHLETMNDLTDSQLCADLAELMANVIMLSLQYSDLCQHSTAELQKAYAKWFAYLAHSGGIHHWLEGWMRYHEMAPQYKTPEIECLYGSMYYALLCLPHEQLQQATRSMFSSFPDEFSFLYDGVKFLLWFHAQMPAVDFKRLNQLLYESYHAALFKIDAVAEEQKNQRLTTQVIECLEIFVRTFPSEMLYPIQLHYFQMIQAQRISVKVQTHGFAIGRLIRAMNAEHPDYLRAQTIYANCNFYLARSYEWEGNYHRAGDYYHAIIEKISDQGFKEQARCDVLWAYYNAAIQYFAAKNFNQASLICKKLRDLYDTFEDQDLEIEDFDEFDCRSETRKYDFTEPQHRCTYQNFVTCIYELSGEIDYQRARVSEGQTALEYLNSAISYFQDTIGRTLRLGLMQRVAVCYFLVSKHDEAMEAFLKALLGLLQYPTEKLDIFEFEDCTPFAPYIAPMICAARKGEPFKSYSHFATTYKYLCSLNQNSNVYHCAKFLCAQQLEEFDGFIDVGDQKPVAVRLKKCMAFFESVFLENFHQAKQLEDLLGTSFHVFISLLTTRFSGISDGARTALFPVVIRTLSAMIDFIAKTQCCVDKLSSVLACYINMRRSWPDSHITEVCELFQAIFQFTPQSTRIELSRLIDRITQEIEELDSRIAAPGYNEAIGLFKLLFNLLLTTYDRDTFPNTLLQKSLRDSACVEGELSVVDLWKARFDAICDNNRTLTSRALIAASRVFSIELGRRQAFTSDPLELPGLVISAPAGPAPNSVKVPIVRSIGI